MTIPVPHFHRVAAPDHYCIDLIEEQTVLHDAGDRGVSVVRTFGTTRGVN